MLILQIIQALILTMYGVFPANVMPPMPEAQSMEQLTAFLAYDDTSEIIHYVAGSDGVIQLNNQCEDRAFQLRDRAALQGIKLETEILTKAECIQYQQYLDCTLERIEAMPENNSHMICKAFVGNEVWFIEPGNDNIWLAYYLD